MAGINDGLAGTLFKINFKINTEDHGFNESWHVQGGDVAAARTKAIAIATARRRIMPADCEIAYATMSKDDSKRDSKFIPEARGAGLIIGTGVSPPPTTVNDDKTAVKIRFENDGGGSETRLLVGVPDGEVTSNALVNLPTDVTATFAAADPAEGDLTLFALQLTNFMKIITKHAINVRAGHAPGAVYTWWPYTAAYYVGIGKKKGGKIFIL